MGTNFCPTAIIVGIPHIVSRHGSPSTLRSLLSRQTTRLRKKFTHHHIFQFYDGSPEQNMGAPGKFAGQYGAVLFSMLTKYSTQTLQSSAFCVRRHGSAAYRCPRSPRFIHGMDASMHIVDDQTGCAPKTLSVFMVKEFAVDSSPWGSSTLTLSVVSPRCC